MKLNENYDKLKKNYLFAEIERRVNAFKQEGVNDLISLGVGDVTIPLPSKIIEAGKKAVQEMGDARTFRGYAPNGGYDFLITAIIEYYAKRGVKLKPSEVFVSDGAKSDCANLLNLFAQGNTVLVPDPVYPVYVDTNTLHGNSVKYVSANKSNGFLPLPDDSIECDIIYICSPNNPTGAVYDRAGLTKWVNYAVKKNAVILFDAAYEAFISNGVHSIFEIENAKSVAVEMGTLSKLAGFTGVRCGYTIIPEQSPLNVMWTRNRACSYNGTAYIVQRMAECALTDGFSDCEKSIAVYKENARLIASTMKELNIEYFGGENSPYIWFECKDDSWAMFDEILHKAHIIVTPGAGFGVNGEGYIRMTAFNTKENTILAMKRFTEFMKNR